MGTLQSLSLSNLVDYLSRKLNLNEMWSEKCPQETYIYFYHKLDKDGQLLVAIPQLYEDFYHFNWTGYNNVQQIAETILFDKAGKKINWDREIKIRDSRWGKKIRDINIPLSYHIKYTKKDVPCGMKKGWVNYLSDPYKKLTKEQFSQYKKDLLGMLQDPLLESKFTKVWEEYFNRNEEPRVAQLKAQEIVQKFMNILK